jgi:hypothetical protein
MKQKCIECGCTDNKACSGGCSWVAPNYCSSCATDNALKERFMEHWRTTFGSYDGRELEPTMIFQFVQREKHISGAVGFSAGLEQLEDIQDYRIKTHKRPGQGSPRKKVAPKNNN